MPRVAETAKSGASKAKTGATKVRGQLDRLPGRNSGNDAPDPATVNGTRPVDLA
jgi:hypothetical protein